MIELIRKKGPFKILEKRYVTTLKNNKGYDVVKFYSLKKIGKPDLKNKILFINLTANKELIWKNFKKNYKKHINKEKKNGITINLTTKTREYELFYKGIYKKLCKRKKLKPYPLDYMKQGDLWLAKKNNKIISGQIIFNDKIWATQSFSASIQEEYNGSRLITWEAIKYYQKKGLKEFNFGGGYSNYKKRFGTEEKTIYIYQMINNKIYKILKRGLLKFTKWKIK